MRVLIERLRSTLARRAAGYGIAVGAPLAFTAAVSLVSGWPRPYSWQYLGVTIFVAVLAGVGPGLAALALSFAAVIWLQVPTPVHPGAEMFAATGLCLLALLDRWRRTEAELTTRAEALRVSADALKASQGTLDAFFGAAPAILNLFDSDLRYVDTDATTPSYFGLNRPTLRGRALADVAPDFAAAFGPMMRRVIETGEPELQREVEGTAPARGGETAHWTASYFPVPLADGSRGLGVIGVEVTEVKRAEAALRESTTLLRAISDGSGDAIFAKDLEGRLRFANPATLALIGKPLDQVLGKTDIELLEDQDSARRVMENDRQVMESGAATELEEVLPLPDGTTRVWLSRKAPYRDAGGNVVGLLGISRDITDRKRADAALQEANEQLRDADRRKNDFIAVLSHELRNPLAPIRYALPLLEAESHGTAARRALQIIHRQADHLAHLVDDLLDVSRIARDTIELRRERVTLASILTSAADAASPGILAARHDFHLDIPDDPVWIDADAPRIAQVVTNLLNNAARYTRRGGRIEMSAASEGAHAVIRVRDNGIGIPPESLTSIFDMFRQLDRSDSSSHQEGLGIGLGLAKRLVELHGGTIHANSRGLGQGAEFVVRLPLADTASAPVPARSTDATGPAGGRLKVLVVDDNVDLVEMLAMVVELEGHDVRKALDGRSAISAALAYRPDVVLLDLGLPLIGGIDVARELRDNPDMRSVRLVALTGWGQPEDRERTAEAGFDHHLTKPTDPRQLTALLRDLAAHDLTRDVRPPVDRERST